MMHEYRAGALAALSARLDPRTAAEVIAEGMGVTSPEYRGVFALRLAAILPGRSVPGFTGGGGPVDLSVGSHLAPTGPLAGLPFVAQQNRPVSPQGLVET